LSPEHYQFINEYLARLYDVALYERNGIQHPVVNYPASPGQASDVNSVIGHLSENFIGKDDLEFYNYAYLHTLQNSGRNLFNGTTYALKRLRTNPLRVDGAPGKYFDMLATCIALEDELMDVMGQGMIRLPMRSQYHRAYDAQKSLLSGKGRSAAIGAVMLIVFNSGAGYRAILSQRTGQHATRPNAFHLLPAFIFQPMDDNAIQEEWSLKHHLYREYLEELVGMEEGDSSMLEHPALHDLQAMEADGRASIRLTGISINLLTLRAEISTVLVIHDERWWQTMQSGEKGYRLNTPETQNQLILIPMENDESALEHLPENYYLNMVPQAIPAFWDGIDSARLLIEEYDG